MHMIYVHLTLLHIPVVVHRRDILTMQTSDSWPRRTTSSAAGAGGSTHCS